MYSEGKGYDVQGKGMMYKGRGMMYEGRGMMYEERGEGREEGRNEEQSYVVVNSQLTAVVVKVLWCSTQSAPPSF